MKTRVQGNYTMGAGIQACVCVCVFACVFCVCETEKKSVETEAR